MQNSKTQTKSIDGIVRSKKKPAGAATLHQLFKHRIFIAAIVLILVTAAYVLLNSKTDLQVTNGLKSVTEVKSKVSQHMLLPTDEEPALATVTDTTKLTNPFLKKANNGDKLLIYQNNKRIIIYRPSIDKIVDVGPIEIATPVGGAR